MDSSGPDQEIEIELDSGLEANLAALEVLDGDPDRAALADALGATSSQAGEILGTLVDAGAIVADGAGEEVAGAVVPLAEVVRAAVLGELGPRGEDGPTVATAEELLMLPAGLGAPLTARALRAFVAGVEPDLRLRAYCEVARSGVPAVLGDLPDPHAAERALDQAHREGAPSDLRTVHIETGITATVDPDRLERLGCDRPHRLGPLLTLTDGSERMPDPSLHLCSAHFALPNLGFPHTGPRLASGRSSDPELAAVIARAEAAERYGGGDPAPHELHRALESELRAPPLHVDLIHRPNARQLAGETGIVAYDPSLPHTWIEGAEADGTRRSVPAGAVFYPFEDPERRDVICPATSSGVAAHSDPDEARRRALAELIERDAFMWTWIQRVSREHVDKATVDATLGERMTAVEATGLSVALVNLTLETLPVILCVLHGEATLSMGMACERDPGNAATRAFDEAVGVLPHLRAESRGSARPGGRLVTGRARPMAPVRRADRARQLPLHVRRAGAARGHSRAGRSGGAVGRRDRGARDSRAHVARHGTVSRSARARAWNGSDLVRIRPRTAGNAPLGRAEDDPRRPQAGSGDRRRSRRPARTASVRLISRRAKWRVRV